MINCVGRLSGDTVQLVEANVLITARLIEAVTREAPAARLVVLGSAAGYGQTSYGRRVDEDHPPSPVAPYGVTRLASTQLVLLAATVQAAAMFGGAADVDAAGRGCQRGACWAGRRRRWSSGAGIREGHGGNWARSERTGISSTFATWRPRSPRRPWLSR